MRTEYNLIHRGFATDYQILNKYKLYKSKGQSGWDLERLLDEQTLTVETLPTGVLPTWFSLTDDVSPIEKKKIKAIYEIEYEELKKRKISIVMTHWNRKVQLYRTLVTISRLYSKYNYEVIIVDDASDINNNIKEFEEFPNVKVIEISEKEKADRVNPCVPYNVGFKEITGDIVIIQNSENFHLFDMIEDIHNNFQENDYIAYGCYKLTKNVTEMLDTIDWVEDDFIKGACEYILPTNDVSMGDDFACGWYVHSKLRPSPYHFCSVISKDNLIDKLGGFDERYSEGSSFDDDEILHRIDKLGLNIKLINEPFVIHQYHSYPETTHHQNMWEKNKELYYENTLKEETCRAKVTRL
jgi:glycosyltransferase involved in cell wall biosynthesis